MLLVLEYVSATPEGGWRAFLAPRDEAPVLAPLLLKSGRFGWADAVVLTTVFAVTWIGASL
jgi:hypothetical protein